jgi:tetratricopeptide (TPR) repeat protein
MSQAYNPGAPDAPNWQREFQRAFNAYSAGDFDGAISICRQLEWTEGEHPAVLHLLGTVLTLTGRVTEGREAIERSLAINARNPQALVDMALGFRMEGRFDLAHQTIDDALRIMPTYPASIRAKAELLNREGAPDKAFETADAAYRQGIDHPHVILALGEAAVETGHHDRAAEVLTRLIENEKAHAQQRASACFMLGTIRDQARDYDSAWTFFERGNQLTPNPWDPAVLDQWVDRQIAAYSPDALGAIPRATSTTEAPIFIVGFPRSGTTLVEQILASHPQVHGAGERSLIPVLSRAHSPEQLTPELCNKIQAEYLEGLRIAAPEGALRITDKQPGNYLNLGFISRVLPGARVIHCTREPLDACLSCYAQDFAYQRAITHFESVLDLPMMTIAYEDLIADQDGSTRNLVDFAGLPWDDACLEPHKAKRGTITASFAQVRKPVYRSSVGRWRNYEKHLGPLKRALGVEE